MAAPPPFPVTTEDSVQTLSEFGSELRGVTKDNPATEQQKKQILDLSNVPLPVARAVKKNAVLMTGIDNANFRPVVLRSDSGEEIEPCNIADNAGNENPAVYFDGSGNDVCDIQVIEPTDELATALNATKPIHGKILKDGKEIPATFIVEVKALYKGSWCQTYVSSGEVYTICWDLPNF